jgi:ATP-dependent RNA helicase DDX42
VFYRYFEDDEEEAVPDLAYIPAPGSPTRVEMTKKQQPVTADDDDDPLDAYMAGIEKQVGIEIRKTQFVNQVL